MLPRDYTLLRREVESKLWLRKLGQLGLGWNPGETNANTNIFIYLYWPTFYYATDANTTK